MSGTEHKESKEEHPTIDEEVKEVLKEIPDLAEEEVVIEDIPKKPEYVEGADSEKDIPEGQESDYGI